MANIFRISECLQFHAIINLHLLTWISQS